MSILTPIFGFIKSQTGDNIGKTIGEDLPANWDKAEQLINSLVAEGVLKVYKTLVAEPFAQTTKTTVNCGFKPRLITIQANISETEYESIAYITQDGTAHYIYTIVGTTNKKQISAGRVVEFMYANSNNEIYANISITDTGFELTWTVKGTLTGASSDRRMIIVAQA